MGWVPPRGLEHGELIESVGGQRLLRLMIETRSVPAVAIQRLVSSRCKQIEAETGRKPGKKEARALKAETRLALLPAAFPKSVAVNVWINPETQRLVIDSTSKTHIDNVLTALTRSIEGFQALLIQTTTSPTAAMANWLLSQESPAGFSIDRECALEAADESKAVVKYGNHALNIDEVQQHISEGKLPTYLAMTWGGRVSFVLTNSFRLKKIAFVDGVIDKSAEHADDRFDADAAIATGELELLIPALIDALGGEVKIGGAA